MGVANHNSAAAQHVTPPISLGFLGSPNIC